MACRRDRWGKSAHALPTGLQQEERGHRTSALAGSQDMAPASWRGALRLLVLGLVVEGLSVLKSRARSSAQLESKALTWAARTGDESRVRALLDQGVPINVRTPCEEIPAMQRATPLIWASRENRVGVIEVLVEASSKKGAALDLEAVTARGDTALRIATERGHSSVVETLLRHGASVDSVMGDADGEGSWIAAKLERMMLDPRFIRKRGTTPAPKKRVSLLSRLRGVVFRTRLRGLRKTAWVDIFTKDLNMASVLDPPKSPRDPTVLVPLPDGSTAEGSARLNPSVPAAAASWLVDALSELIKEEDGEGGELPDDDDGGRAWEDRAWGASGS